MDHLIGPVEDFADGERRVVRVGEVEVGIFRLDGAFHAWRNECPHQGGPVCQGRLFHRVVDNIDEHKKVHGRKYDEDHLNIVCPWHGAEFDIRTGHHTGTDALRLTPVETQVRGGEVWVRV